MCSKSLIEARDEITEMKRKLKIMSHQIDQLKEEIAAKASTHSQYCTLFSLLITIVGACTGEEQCRLDSTGA